MIETCYELLYSLPLSLLILAAWGRLSSPEALLSALLALGVCILLKSGPGRLRLLLPGALLILMAGAVLMQEPGTRAGFIVEKLPLLFVALTASACFLLSVAAGAFVPVRRILAFVLILSFAAALMMGEEIGRAEAVPGIFLLLLVLAEEAQLFRKGNIPVNPKAHMVSLSPFLLCIGILAFLAPAPAHPFDWGFVTDLMGRAVSFARSVAVTMGMREEYKGIAGFSEGGITWGDLSGEEKEVMSIVRQKDLGEVLCLEGAILDTFDGREWSTRQEWTESDRRMDALQTFAAVEESCPEHSGELLREASFVLVMEDFHTRHVFSPPKLILPAGNPENEYLKSGKREYPCSYYRMNFGNEELLRLLREGEADPGGLAEYGARFGVRDAWKEFPLYRERIDSGYLPETAISTRAEDYLEELLAGAGTDYDRLCKIQELLSSFSYSLTPGELPPDIQSPADFLDYLLFEKQEGYCSHFATAFVIMARSRGIPARFVEGFRVPVSGKEKTTITSSMAHAWPEAYLEGVGWIAFEPTPGRTMDRGWEGEAVSLEPPPEGRVLPRPVLSRDEAPAPEEEQARSSASAGAFWIPVFLAVLFLLAFIVAERLSGVLRARKMSPGERFRACCKENLRLLSFFGLILQEGETLSEFRERALGMLEPESLGFLSDYERMLYAEVVPDEGMLHRAVENRGGLQERLRKEKGLPVFMLYCITGFLGGDTV